MGFPTSRHTRKNRSFSTQDKRIVLLGLEALPYAAHLHYATCSKYGIAILENILQDEFNPNVALSMASCGHLENLFCC